MSASTHVALHWLLPQFRLPPTHTPLPAPQLIAQVPLEQPMLALPQVPFPAQLTWHA
jgi:hypothetical protein